MAGHGALLEAGMGEETTDIQRVTCCPARTMVELGILASLAVITTPRHPPFLETSSRIVGGTAIVMTRDCMSQFGRGKRSAKRANIMTIFLPEAAGLTRKNTTVACSADRVVAQSLAAVAGTITRHIPTNDLDLRQIVVVQRQAHYYLGVFNPQRYLCLI
jgi:hypothetical protein